MKKLLPLAIALAACSAPHEGETTYPGGELLSPAAIAQAKVHPDFVQHVKPVLQTRCVICHNKKTLPGHMSLENADAALKPGAAGVPAIVPGHPEASLLVANIGRTHANLRTMPMVGEQVTANELAILRKWITDGAAWPKGRAGRLAPHLP